MSGDMNAETNADDMSSNESSGDVENAIEHASESVQTDEVAPESDSDVVDAALAGANDAVANVETDNATDAATAAATDNATDNAAELEDQPAAVVADDYVADTASTEARAIEAILMVADQPVTSQLLGELLEISPAHVDMLCDAMAAAYIDEQRGFVLVRIAGGYRFQSAPEMSAYVERFVLDGQAARLSAAAMETLAIVAYKQPISRAQVASIRGVNVDGVMRTLVQRGYVAEIAVDPGPGQASLFGTTAVFLEGIGLNHISELPPLGDLVPGADVMEALEASLRIDDESGRPVRGPLVRPGDTAADVAESASVSDLDGANVGVSDVASEPN